MKATGKRGKSYNTVSLNSKVFSIGTSTPGFVGKYGYVFSNAGNNYGKTGGRDAYYLAITYDGKINIGTQLNGTNEITWRTL